MNLNKLILFSSLGIIAASFISVPFQTELSIREAKKKIVEGVQMEEMRKAFGEFQRIETKEKQDSYLSDTNLTIKDAQQLWVSGQEGISYWNILLITNESGQLIAGDVDRLW
ncbi:MAG: hypothetical protein ACSHX8_07905 [Opitutaceae bacterium]